MDDAPLTGTRMLVLGADRAAVEAVTAELTAAGASAAVTDVAQVAARAAATAAQAVICLGDIDPASVRTRLDPLGLGAAPPIVELADGRPLDPRRLQLELENRALRDRVGELEAIVAGQVASAVRDAEAIRVDALRRLTLAAAYRDDNSPEHPQRVGALAARLARRLGQEDRIVRLVRQAAPLHDLGKIAIPDSILLKPGSLEPAELEVVKTHAVLGARVLAGGDSELFAVAERIARSHHERWDGGGYPDGLAGAAIPLVARLVSVADVFDVLVHERPHREARTVEEAAAEIRAGAGTQFDPDVVAAFDALGAGSWTVSLESIR